MDSKWCRSLWLHLAAGISESGDTFRICHFLVPPRAEHPGQKPICQTTCPQFIVFTCFYIDLDKGRYLDYSYSWIVAWLVPLASVASEASLCPWTILGLLLSCVCKPALWSWASCVTCQMPGLCNLFLLSGSHRGRAVVTLQQGLPQHVLSVLPVPLSSIYQNSERSSYSKITHQISCPHSPSSEHFQSQSVLSLCWALTARPATYSIWADEAAASFPPCPRRTFFTATAMRLKHLRNYHTGNMDRLEDAY